MPQFGQSARDERRERAVREEFRTQTEHFTPSVASVTGDEVGVFTDHGSDDLSHRLSLFERRLSELERHARAGEDRSRRWRMATLAVMSLAMMFALTYWIERILAISNLLVEILPSVGAADPPTPFRGSSL